MGKGPMRMTTRLRMRMRTRRGETLKAEKIPA
jgi:hypothetical protein